MQHVLFYERKEGREGERVKIHPAPGRRSLWQRLLWWRHGCTWSDGCHRTQGSSPFTNVQTSMKRQTEEKRSHSDEWNHWGKVNFLSNFIEYKTFCKRVLLLHYLLNRKTEYVNVGQRFEWINSSDFTENCHYFMRRWQPVPTSLDQRMLWE